MVWSTAYSRTQQDLFVSVSQVCLNQNYFSFLIFGTQWATCHSNTLQWQTTPCEQVGQQVAATQWRAKWCYVYWRIFVKFFVFATEFFYCDKSHEIKLVWIYVGKLSRSVAVTCWCDLSPSLCLPLNSSFSQLCSIMYKLTFCQKKDFFI